MRGMALVGRFAVTGIVALAAGAQVASADSVKQSYNVGGTPFDSTWGVANVGWTVVASGNYKLTGVDTLFNDFNTAGPDGRTVTVEVYTAAPSLGGVLMGSASFEPVVGTLGGVSGLLGEGTFTTPLVLASGEDYFIGFRNVANLGVNYATSGTSISRLRVGATDNGTYATLAPVGHAGEKGILQLRGEDLAVVPLPGAAVGGMVLMGVLGMARSRRDARA